MCLRFDGFGVAEKKKKHIDLSSVFLQLRTKIIPNEFIDLHKGFNDLALLRPP